MKGVNKSKWYGYVCTDSIGNISITSDTYGHTTAGDAFREVSSKLGSEENRPDTETLVELISEILKTDKNE